LLDNLSLIFFGPAIINLAFLFFTCFIVSIAQLRPFRLPAQPTNKYRILVFLNPNLILDKSFAILLFSALDAGGAIIIFLYLKLCIKLEQYLDTLKTY